MARVRASWRAGSIMTTHTHTQSHSHIQHPSGFIEFIINWYQICRNEIFPADIHFSEMRGDRNPWCLGKLDGLGVGGNCAE